MVEGVNYLFEESVGVVEKYGRYLLKNCMGDIESEWDELASVMMCLCDSKEKFEVQENIFSDFIQTIETRSELSCEEIIEGYNSKLSNAFSKLKLGENNEKYLYFKNLLQYDKIKPQDDSEIKTVSESVNLMDPITKLPFTDPVKNIKCGHSYEKNAILELLKKKKKKQVVKCPIPGCVAAEQVLESDLVPDVAIKKILG